MSDALLIWFVVASALILWFDAGHRRYMRTYRAHRHAALSWWDSARRWRLLFERQGDRGIESLRQDALGRLAVAALVIATVSIPLVILRLM